MFEEIMSLVKKRAEYMNEIGGSSETNIKNINDVIGEIGYISDELNQFKDFKEDDHGELRRLMVEAAASIILMIAIADKDSLWESKDVDVYKILFDKLGPAPVSPSPSVYPPVYHPWKPPTIMKDPFYVPPFEPFWCKTVCDTK